MFPVYCLVPLYGFIVPADGNEKGKSGNLSRLVVAATHASERTREEWQAFNSTRPSENKIPIVLR